MGTRGRVAAVAVAAMLAVGCSPLWREVVSPGGSEHDRTVADLERRSSEEEGWVVLPLPNTHEGGGLTTWWLHPCEPDRDDEREVTRTAYHGSDVADLPGHHQVDTTSLPCRPPSNELEIHGRQLRLDADAVPLGDSSVALVASRDHVEIRDDDHATAHEVAVMTQPTYGPCDGRTHWSATLESDRSLRVSVTSCVGLLAALPDRATGLLTLPSDGDVHRMSSAPLADEHHHELLEALLDAGFDSDDVGVLELEDPQLGSVWYGPCGPTVDPHREDDTQTFVDVYDGYVTVSEQACR